MELTFVHQLRPNEVGVIAFAFEGRARSDIVGPAHLIGEARSFIACGGNDLCWNLRDGIVVGTFVAMRCGRKLVLAGERFLWENYLMPFAQSGFPHVCRFILN